MRACVSPQNPCEQLGMLVYACDPSAGGVGSWASLASHPDLLPLSTLQANERLSRKARWMAPEEWHPTLTSTCAHTAPQYTTAYHYTHVHTKHNHNHIHTTHTNMQPHTHYVYTHQSCLHCIYLWLNHLRHRMKQLKYVQVTLISLFLNILL